jgi:hypothetical protein
MNTVANCPSEHSRTAPTAVVEPVLGVGGWIMNAIVGISARPVKVRWRCKTCQLVFDETRERAIRDQHISA